MIVYLDCGDGVLTAAFGAAEHNVVQGLEVDARKVEKAQAHIHSLGRDGRVVYFGGQDAK